MTEPPVWPPPDLLDKIHDLLADVRAAATAQADPTSNFATNYELISGAYARGPVAAIFIAAQIAALRFDQIQRARRGKDLDPMPFPRQHLETELHVQPASSRRPDAGRAAIDFLEGFIDSLIPEPEPVQALIQAHGVFAFGRMLRLGTVLAEMLVEADPQLVDLPDLLQREALADETEWIEMLKRGES